MKHVVRLVVWLLLASSCLGDQELEQQAQESIHKGVAFFQTISSHGGYVYHVTPDLKQRWGEVPLDANTIEVQPPGTPAVGQSFLRAYRVTGDKTALDAARSAARALIRGQNKHGGWDHTIDFDDLTNERVSFDDNQSQSAVRFLMALDQEMDDEEIASAAQRAIAMMIQTQLDSGGWPHQYPRQGNYHDYATYNDNGINDCIRVMTDARHYYTDNKAIEKSLREAARFVVTSQLPPPQPGWAQQYNEFMQPAWARSFEPPSVCPSVTLRNINTLIDLYLVLGDRSLLEPIPDSLRWLREIRMDNGKWARFVELGTNKPLYYDRGRIRVDSIDELHIERRRGYAYEINLQGILYATSTRYERAIELGRRGLQKAEQPDYSESSVTDQIDRLETRVRRIIEAQEASGAWISRGARFRKRMPRGERWNGQYDVADRISSSVFNRNIAALCEYIELCGRLRSPE